MTPSVDICRRRVIDSLRYARPDRLPVIYHSSPAGLYVHGEKLLRLFHELPPDNAVQFTTIPQPPAGTVGPDGKYHELRRDEWGTEWEYRIFGLHGHPHQYPFASWEEALASYQFPEIPPSHGPKFAAEKARNDDLRRRYALIDGWVIIFERLHALRPMDEVLMDLASGEPALLSFLDRLVAHYERQIRYYLDIGIDLITFGDDWGTQERTLVSPALFRDIFVPHYRRLFAPIKAAGARVLFHSCGQFSTLIDDIFGLGIDVLWHQVARYDHQKLSARAKESGVSLLIHPDRQRLIPLGTPAQIDSAIAGYARWHRSLGGGAIFYVEIENDAPWENVEALVRAIDRYR